MRSLLIALLWFSLATQGYAQLIRPLAAPPRLGQVEEVPNQEGAVGRYRTEDMIGPLPKANRLFPNLKSSSDYRYQSFQSAPTTRPEANASFYAWATPNFAHRPLYFEQPNLERYGIKRFPLLNPPLSAGQFYASVAMLPYKVLHELPNRPVYTLGHNRPGDWTPVQGITSLAVRPGKANKSKSK